MIEDDHSTEEATTTLVCGGSRCYYSPRPTVTPRQARSHGRDGHDVGVSEGRRTVRESPGRSGQDAVPYRKRLRPPRLDGAANARVSRRRPHADAVSVRSGRVDVVAHSLLVQVVTRIGGTQVARRL